MWVEVGQPCAITRCGLSGYLGQTAWKTTHTNCRNMRQNPLKSHGKGTAATSQASHLITNSTHSALPTTSLSAEIHWLESINSTQLYWLFTTGNSLSTANENFNFKPAFSSDTSRTPVAMNICHASLTDTEGNTRDARRLLARLPPCCQNPPQEQAAYDIASFYSFSLLTSYSDCIFVPEGKGSCP